LFELRRPDPGASEYVPSRADNVSNSALLQFPRLRPGAVREREFVDAFEQVFSRATNCVRVYAMGRVPLVPRRLCSAKTRKGNTGSRVTLPTRYSWFSRAQAGAWCGSACTACSYRPRASRPSTRRSLPDNGRASDSTMRRERSS